MTSAAALLAAALCSCAHASKGAPDKGWLELTSDHFVLRTDLVDWEARKVIAELENVRAALLAFSWKAAQAPSDRLHVVELADAAELSAYASRGIGGYFTDDPFRERLMVMSAEQSPSQQTILKHELAHHLNSYFLLRQPRWLGEGLAAFLETLRYDHAQDKWYFGEVSRERLDRLRQRPVRDWGSVLAMKDAYLTDRTLMVDFEDAAWLLVHWMVNERSQQLNDFIGRMAKAEDPDQAFRASFAGLGADEIARAVEVYRQHGRFLKAASSLPAWNGNVAQKQLDVADVRALKALLHHHAVGFPDRTEQHRRALAEADAALALAPGHPMATGVKLSLQKPPPAERAEAARAVTKAWPQDWRGWSLLSQALADQPGPERTAALEKLIELAPDNSRGLQALAFERLRAGKAPEAFALAHRAAKRSPGDPGVLDTYSVTLAANGRCDDAQAIQRRAIDAVPDRAPPEFAQHLRARLAELPQICRQAAAVAEQSAPVGQARPSAACGGPPTVTHKEGAAPPEPVTVRFTVRADGTVADVERAEGDERVFKAIKAWLEACRFDPATRGGKPIESKQVFRFGPPPKP